MSEWFNTYSPFGNLWKMLASEDMHGLLGAFHAPWLDFQWLSDRLLDPLRCANWRFCPPAHRVALIVCTSALNTKG